MTTGWKLGICAAVLAGGVIAYALNDSGTLPGLGPSVTQPGASMGAEESAYWTPQQQSAAIISEPEQRAAMRVQAMTQEQRLRYQPWGIEPDIHDPGMTEEKKDALDVEWKQRMQAFEALPREQQRSIRQQCQQKLEQEPTFDCSTLWLNSSAPGRPES